MRFDAGGFLMRDGPQAQVDFEGAKRLLLKRQLHGATLPNIRLAITPARPLRPARRASRTNAANDEALTPPSAARTPPASVRSRATRPPVPRRVVSVKFRTFELGWQGRRKVWE